MQHTAKFTLVATCLFGLEKFVGEELDALGLERLDTMDGRVFFKGDARDIARANISLSTAERVLVLLGQFPALTFDELFEGVKKIGLEDWIGPRDAFPVKGHCIKSGLFSVPDCQRIIKKAAVSRLSGKYGISWFEETGTTYQIEFFLFKDTAYIMLDTSGDVLHKRGWRRVSNDAPVRETIAAALVRCARPRREYLLWDPLCGSGTIAIEGACYLAGIAPGINRSFAAEAYPAVGKALFDGYREECRARISGEPYEVYGSDVDERALGIAANNAALCGFGVKDHIKFFKMDVRDIKTDGRRGSVLCNPPYGERMGDRESARALYSLMGKAFLALDNWQIYVLAADEEFERHFGARADKIRKLYNGMMKVNLYQYFKPRVPR